MKTKPYYSIIVPVFNVENQIKKCVDSILLQTFKNFELILIDDGSTDDSGIICDQYAEKDKRIVVLHQKNQGVSAARNAGIQKSIGEYIVFVDSDDFVDKDILNHLNQSDADLVIVGFSDYSGETVTKIVLDDNERWMITSDEEILHFLKKKTSVFVWGKRYKKSIIDRWNIKFRCDMKFSEDIVFNNEYILRANTVVNIKWPGYYHCQYKFETLSSLAEKNSFIERTMWRKVSYKQFEGHPAIQRVYVQQMLYFAEKEFIILANKKEKIFVKYNNIKRIVADDFFQLSIRVSPKTLPFDILIFCRLKLIIPIIFKYTRKR